MATNNIITDELNFLRSILHSVDHLQIRSAGNLKPICLRLDYDIQITFFIDSLNTITKRLTINNVRDLHLNRLSNECLLQNEQWINIQNYFNEIIQQSNSETSLRSIIQLMQNYLLQISTEDASIINEKVDGGDQIFNRISYDTTIDRSQVVIGYEDRSAGIHEIPFNEFKKVDDDEYGSRIRYYKINGRVVWDRTQKFDFLNSCHNQNEAIHDIKQKPNLVEGMYQFDKLTHQWILCPHLSLTSDDLTNPSTTDMYIPERCQFLTWNILSDNYQSELIYTKQRYESILHTLKSFLPDIICLQEVTSQFLNLLLDEVWLRENNYYIITMRSILDSNGQLMLMRNFRPRAFSICPLDFSNDSITTRKNDFITARFGLNSELTIDLVNLHLHDKHSSNSDEQRCRSLEYFFKKMNTQNYMLIGDFNFDDYDIKEQNILQRYQYKIHDLWKDAYDLDENPGFTFDPSRNICAQITSDSQVSRRLDRYLFHTLYNLYYSIEHLSIVASETITIDSSNNKHINQSDHYALQLIIRFRIRSISHRSALVILPSGDKWPLICKQYDPSVDPWPPHIKLIWPFYDLIDTEDNEENILLPLRLLLAQHESFNIEINSFNKNNISYMKLSQQSSKFVEELHEHIKQFFPQCSENNYYPSMTIEQSDTDKNRVQSILTLTEPIQFPVQYIYILQRSDDDDTTPFHITYQLPLGSVLKPIGLNRFNYVSFELENYFHKMNLYESEQSYEQKREKFHRLSSHFEQTFNKNTLHCYTHAFLPYGSFRLGLNGEDLDTVFVLSEEKSLDNETELDRVFLRLRHDPFVFNNHLVDLLEAHILDNLKNEIIDCRKIQALYPILSILFNDQTRVEIFVQIKIKSILDEDHEDLLSNFHEPVHGVHDIERLIAYVRSPPIFQYLLTFVRTWAQHVGLYGQVYGYLGGYSWAILCAYISHSFISAIHSLFSIEHFFILIKKFFSTYSQFNWSLQSLRLHSKCYKQIDSSNHSEIYSRGSMDILCPSPPFNNTSRSTINSTRQLIIEGFQHVSQLMEKSMTYEDCLTEILQLSNQFPHKTIQSILQLTLSGQTINEVTRWIGYMKSRLAHFLTDCEDECNLFVQTQNFVEDRRKTLERFYSIGFQLDVQILSRHRQFYYTLNRFLDQFKICSFRSETMKISYKLMSRDQWNSERMQLK